MTKETKPIKQMSKKKQSFFATRTIFAFLKRCVGVGALPNVSMYEMASMALKHHGYEAPDGVSVKVWCKSMTDTMRDLKASEDIAKLRKSIYELSQYRSANKIEAPRHEVTAEVVEARRKIREVSRSQKGEKKLRSSAKKQPAKVTEIKSRPKDMSGSDFVKTNEFLWSYEWRTLRTKVLKYYGPKCMCCGATPASGEVMNVDHIKPRKFYPELALDFDNMQVLCSACNMGKGNWDETDWRPKA